jgi:hypothetical protein
VEEKTEKNNRAGIIIKSLTQIAKAVKKEMAGKISFTKEDQKRILSASGDFKSGIMELLLEVIGMHEETRQAVERAKKAENQIGKLKEQIRQMIERQAQRKTEGPSEETGSTPQGVAPRSDGRRGGPESPQNTNRGTRKHTDTGAKEEEAEETGGGVDHCVICPEAEGENPGKARNTGEHGRPERSRSEEDAEWGQHPGDWRTTRSGTESERRLAASGQPKRRTEEEAGRNTEEEAGSPGEANGDVKSHNHSHGIGDRMEAGGSGAGHVGKERVDQKRENQRAVYRRGKSALKARLQRPQEAERRLDDGHQDSGGVPEEKESTGRTDTLLDGREIRNQLPLLRPPEEGLQTGADLLQVRGAHLKKEERKRRRSAPIASKKAGMT